MNDEGSEQLLATTEGGFFLPDSFFQQDFHLKLFLIRHIERFDTLNEATSMDNNTHQIRHLSIDFTDHSISSNGVELSIDHKAVEVLQLLIAHAGHTVTTDQVHGSGVERQTQCPGSGASGRGQAA